MPDFRHPAVFFLTRHPFLFLACDFFQLDFAAEVGALAKEGVEPEKNIRPVRSATIIIKVFGMIIQFSISWSQAGGNHAVGALGDIFFSLPFYVTLMKNKIRRRLECREEGTELIGQNTRTGLGKSLSQDGGPAGFVDNHQGRRRVTYLAAAGSPGRREPWAPRSQAMTRP
jgi:hypothetical protein